MEKYLISDNAWYLPKKVSDKCVWKSRKEGREELKKNHPFLYLMMTRHESMKDKDTDVM